MKRIKKVNELLDPETLRRLNIKPIKREDYFFGDKEVNKIYDAHIFEIIVKSMKMETGGKAVLIDLLVSYKLKEYGVGIVYMDDENVFYGSMYESEYGIEELREDMGESNMEVFDDVTEQIINDLIPEDFWEIRTRES